LSSDVTSFTQPNRCDVENGVSRPCTLKPKKTLTDLKTFIKYSPNPVVNQYLNTLAYRTIVTLRKSRV